ncbi:glycosyltransferase family 2 protein [Geobacter grbiciae]|uniref:glycosyltransferase family 2 protein n=1 Tax=Geobacter grbiciae TaxID=155042 RepID=UPI001C00FA8F|nr:glycosyltransferase family 2 protein [Geobacter grbiciae]MBT1074658.1 glycosyltransferase [Geobacter grbiciae]
MSIEVSVIIPTYNRANLIEQTITSIINQTLLPKEIIVVDDGSTDNTEEVVRQLGTRVRYLRIDNSGQCRARNVGVSAATSTWVAFCDSDDLWLPNKLEVQGRLINEAPDVEYMFTNFKIVVNDIWTDKAKFDTLPKSFFSGNKYYIKDDYCVIGEPLFRKLLFNQPIFPSTVLMKRSLFDKIGGFVDSLGRTLSEDLEFSLRCVNQAPIGIVMTPLVGIRKHDSNFSNDSLKNKMGEIDILQYVMVNHKLNNDDVSAVKNQISHRSADVVRQAFAVGDLQTVIKYFRMIPPAQRTSTMYIKAIIACFPGNWGRYMSLFITKTSLIARGK